MVMRKSISKDKAADINSIILENALGLAIEELPPQVKYRNIARAFGLTTYSARAIGQILAWAKDDIEYWYLVFSASGTLITPENLWKEQLSKYRAFCEDLGIPVDAPADYDNVSSICPAV